jgi:hypothetical protein
LNHWSCVRISHSSGNYAATNKREVNPFNVFTFVDQDISASAGTLKVCAYEGWRRRYDLVTSGRNICDSIDSVQVGHTASSDVEYPGHFRASHSDGDAGSWFSLDRYSAGDGCERTFRSRLRKENLRYDKASCASKERSGSTCEVHVDVPPDLRLAHDVI